MSSIQQTNQPANTTNIPHHLSFDAWMSLVDAYVRKTVMLSVHDLVDSMFADMWQDGYAPDQAGDVAISNDEIASGIRLELINIKLEREREIIEEKRAEEAEKARQANIPAHTIHDFDEYVKANKPKASVKKGWTYTCYTQDRELRTDGHAILRTSAVSTATIKALDNPTRHRCYGSDELRKSETNEVWNEQNKHRRAPATPRFVLVVEDYKNPVVVLATNDGQHVAYMDLNKFMYLSKITRTKKAKQAFWIVDAEGIGQAYQSMSIQHDNETVCFLMPVRVDVDVRCIVEERCAK
jgi:hypothetical protein